MWFYGTSYQEQCLLYGIRNEGRPIGLSWSLFQEIQARQFVISCRLGRFALASPREVCAVAGLGKDIHSKG